MYNIDKKIKEQQRELEGVIEACNKILHTGSHLYKTSKDTASAVWKVTTSPLFSPLPLSSSPPSFSLLSDLTMYIDG